LSSFYFEDLVYYDDRWIDSNCINKYFSSPNGIYCLKECNAIQQNIDFNLAMKVCFCDTKLNLTLSLSEEGICNCKQGFIYSEEHGKCAKNCAVLEKIEYSQINRTEYCSCDEAKNAIYDEMTNECVCKNNYHLNSEGLCQSDSSSYTRIVIYSLLGFSITVIIVIIVILLYFIASSKDDQIMQEHLNDIYGVENIN
ncbi:MAG: hypothetical protein MHPSP_001421, partial [Paramarteilia canceri]